MIEKHLTTTPEKKLYYFIHRQTNGLEDDKKELTIFEEKIQTYIKKLLSNGYQENEIAISVSATLERTNTTNSFTNITYQFKAKVSNSLHWEDFSLKRTFNIISVDYSKQRNQEGVELLTTWNYL
ncbi:MAG: hypothetical protein ACOVOW_11635 [Spirosomataceae bacterium]|jgi:CRISPR/Cas system CSM-associated protein Csm2 small subunit